MERKGLIICVDDEQSVLDTLQEQLTEHFGRTHDILTAPSAEEALELIDTVLEEGEIIEMIITDQVMPGLKGDEFLKIVHKKIPDTTKILLTGQAGLESAINAINEGGLNRYIEKPWNLTSLKEDIQELINKFRENLENQHLLNNLEMRIKELENQVKEN